MGSNLLKFPDKPSLLTFPSMTLAPSRFCTVIDKFRSKIVLVTGTAPTILYVAGV